MTKISSCIAGLYCYPATLSALDADDTTFATAGTGLNTSVSAVRIGGNGKITIGGALSTVANTSAPYLARLTYIGTID